jgi:hypothetical protein
LLVRWCDEEIRMFDPVAWKLGCRLVR